MNNNIICFHPRRQYNFEQAAELAKLYPDRFKHVTSVYFPPRLVRLIKKMAPRYAALLDKRSYHALPSRYVQSMPGTEIKKLWWKRRGKHPDYLSLNRTWQLAVLRRFSPPAVCISYDGASNLIFKEWKNKSFLILDLSIGFPQYRIKMMYGDQFTMEKLDKADSFQRRLFLQYDEEVALADMILCGSEFVRDTIVAFHPGMAGKCRVLPYGADTRRFDYPDRIFVDKSNLKFVFVGTVGWRKGADQLMEVWKDFEAAHPGCELHFFGSVDKEISLKDLPPNLFVHGAVPSGELVKQLKGMDVLVFPTTFEGSALSLYQAMALKLPVITTRNSGTVMVHGESCEMIPAGDKPALLKALNKLYDQPAYRRSLAENAYALSKSYTWEAYRKRIDDIFREAGLTNA